MKKLLEHKKRIFIPIVIIIIILIANFRWYNSLPMISKHASAKKVSYKEVIVSKNKKYEIDSIEDWLQFSNSVNNGEDYSDSVVVLTADLDFEGVKGFVPAGTYHKPFSGNFYGNGYTISNIKINSKEEYIGLFGVARYAIIYGVKLENCDMQSDESYGTGGIIGFADKCKIEDCYYRGKVFGKYGSVGGIVGSNWSEITNCNVYGEIQGSVQIGLYGGSEKGNSYGTGGIAGDNAGIIYECKNYAKVYDDTKEHESHNVRSGGISAYNKGLIESCINYGDVTGGGITKSNRYGGILRLCFNMGSVYSGIAVGAYENSIIENCVNMGAASGRYAGDIVSFWGQKTQEETWAKMSQCLYIDSSKNGFVRENYLKKSSMTENSKIKMPDEKLLAEMNEYIEDNRFWRAFELLLRAEKERRNKVFWVISLAGILGVCGLTVVLCFIMLLKKERKYKMGISCFMEKEYWKAYQLFSIYSDYKDSGIQRKKVLRELLENEEKTILFGEHMGIGLKWQKAESPEDGVFRLIAVNAIMEESIHSTTEAIRWKESELFEKLNTDYKKLWFGEEIEKYLSVEITIPSVAEAREFFVTNEQRKCKSFLTPEGIVTSSGNAYWWLRGEERTQRMPFVTAEGVISERGKPVSTQHIAVRPMVKVRIRYENDS